MSQLKKLCFFLLAVLVPAITIAETPVQNKMMQDLDIIKHTFEVKYAPKDWKMTFTNWGLSDQINQAKVKILENDGITVKEYQKIVRDFFNSTKDYHVGVSFFSTELALLPFRVHGTDNGRYFVAYVDSWCKELPGWDRIPLSIGDEILMFDRRPVGDVVQELKTKELGNPDSATDQSLAESYLTFRASSSGFDVPSGKCLIKVRHNESNIERTYCVEWVHNEEEVNSDIAVSNFANQAFACVNVQKTLFQKKKGNHPFFFKDMSTPHMKTFAQLAKKRAQLKFELDEEHDEDDNEDQFIGSQEGFIPDLGKIVWRAPDEYDFRAYIYENESGKRLGFIRLPTFMRGADSIEEFAKIIIKCERCADALIVDQTNNGGGSLFYMYAIASILSDQPLIVPSQRMTLTQEDVYFAVQEYEQLEEISSDEDARDWIGETLGGYPVDMELAQQVYRYMRFIINQWNCGKIFTDFDYLYGIDYIKPHPKVTFSKPILFLVNQLDFSCADFLPAILQDNNRATIMGAQTAGAGGYVLSHSYPNMFGIADFSYTGSIAQRLDSNPIENLGVRPDIEYRMTERDLQDGYIDYINAINEEVDRLIAQ